MGKQSPRALRILITDDTAASRAGSGPSLVDFARALLRKGHPTVVYGAVPAHVAQALREATVPVVDDLSALNFVPDIIHGQHHLETMTAALHFAGTPVVAACNALAPWEHAPPVFPTIARWIAVDTVCAERLASTGGVDAARIRVIPNGVDIARFEPRAPLPATPRRALLCNSHGLQDACAATVVRACRQAGIAVDLATDEVPAHALRDYDLVFAQTRRALEAMATGCATIIADRAGLAGLVTTTNFDRLRALDFGARAMQAAPVTEAGVLAAIAAYDADDAGRVCGRVRTEANIDVLADATLAQYREAMEAGRFPDPQECTQAAARYLRDVVAPMVKAVEQSRIAQSDAEATRDAHMESGRAAAAAAEKRIGAALQAREAAVTERDMALKAHDEMEARLTRAMQRALDAGIERDAAFASRDEARDAQLAATSMQARTADAYADALRAQGQLALDLADAQARLLALEAQLDAARRAQPDVQDAHPSAYRRFMAKFA
ncbi:Glycosyl transferase [Lysobacter dokdonensis DS-58]|uniref:Glycosyl transferase n=1 Tax=Lysobacter dokdonensis DS-58 TaxID=1300345 RepID=A0A0A2WF38_9GAMM|nr:glycosyltransferase [Lysobacter dokdonensis]KGQ18816.1 Glycosyl transferase [Lysobacter dokdonensis DS-58]